MAHRRDDDQFPIMNPKISDKERRDLPSASMVERIALCPGSWRLAKGLTEEKTPEQQEWADSGSRIHLHLECPEMVDLSPWPEEVDIADECVNQRSSLIEKIFGFPATLGLDAKKVVEYREQRLWWQHNGKDAFSGKLDYSMIGKEAALVVDYKTGRGDVAEAASNLQLRTQALLLWHNLIQPLHGPRGGRKGTTVRKIYVAVVQPLISREPEVCEYTIADLLTAGAELNAILEAIDVPGAPLNPGVKQCQFCPAKLRCPAAVGVLEELSKMSSTHPTGTTVSHGTPPEEIARILDMSKVAGMVISSAKTVARDTLIAGGTIPGWKLEPGGKTRDLGNAAQVYDALSAAGLIDQPYFIAECVNVGIGDTEKAIAKFKSIKLSEAKKALKDATSHIATEGQKKPSLVKDESAAEPVEWPDVIGWWICSE